MLHPTLDVYGMKCLEFDERSARLVVRPCTGQDNQLWDYDGWYVEARSLVMREQVCLSSLNEQLTAWPCNQIPEQRFDRYFAQLVAYEDGLCLSLLGGLDWDVETQAAGLALCSTSDPGQSWVFDCPAPNVCQDLCLGVCECQMDRRTLQPYCLCPGDSCADTVCHNGGESYYDGTRCQCRCAPGFEGDGCMATLRPCEYSGARLSAYPAACVPTRQSFGLSRSMFVLIALARDSHEERASFSVRVEWGGASLCRMRTRVPVLCTAARPSKCRRFFFVSGG